MAALKKAVDAGAGVMMLGGFENFGAGGYADTPLADLLPIELNSADKRAAGGSPDPALHIAEPLKMVPTAAGMSDFVIASGFAGQESRGVEVARSATGGEPLPRDQGFGRVLGQAENGLPLLVAQDIGRGRSMAFAADTTFQWVLGGQRDAHQRFWQQAILWLAHKELQGDEATWLQLSQRRLRPGQPQELTFGARDKDKRPIEDATSRSRSKGRGRVVSGHATEGSDGFHRSFRRDRETGRVQRRSGRDEGGKGDRLPRSRPVSGRRSGFGVGQSRGRSGVDVGVGQHDRGGGGQPREATRPFAATEGNAGSARMSSKSQRFRCGIRGRCWECTYCC